MEYEESVYFVAMMMSSAPQSIHSQQHHSFFQHHFLPIKTWHIIPSPLAPPQRALPLRR